MEKDKLNYFARSRFVWLRRNTPACVTEFQALAPAIRVHTRHCTTAGFTRPILTHRTVPKHAWASRILAARRRQRARTCCVLGKPIRPTRNEDPCGRLDAIRRPDRHRPLGLEVALRGLTGALSPGTSRNAIGRGRPFGCPGANQGFSGAASRARRAIKLRRLPRTQIERSTDPARAPVATMSCALAQSASGRTCAIRRSSARRSRSPVRLRSAARRAASDSK